MSKLVEGVSEKIEAYAKKEFMEKGYMDASLRTIAAEAGTSTGSIYSRYGGKEGLFSAIVEPAAKELVRIFTDIQEDFHAIDPDRQQENLDNFTQDGMQQIVAYIYDHLEEVKTPEEMAELLGKEYNISGKEILEDVKEVLVFLEKNEAMIW